MLNHQVGEALTVDQDHALRQVAHELGRLLAEKAEVVTNTPFVAPSPTRLPTNACTSGRPTLLPGPYRFACT
jgi:hypothetical protein